jgi:hypothetical protein
MSVSRSRHGMRRRQSSSASGWREEGRIGRLGCGLRAQRRNADSKHTGEDGETDHQIAPGAGLRVAISQHSRQMVLEVTVSKRLSAPYRSGPSRDWIKAAASAFTTYGHPSGSALRPSWADSVAKVWRAAGVNFFRTAQASFEKSCGGPPQRPRMLPTTSPTALEACEWRFLLTPGCRDLCRPQFFGFCNRIGHKQSYGSFTPRVE